MLLTLWNYENCQRNGLHDHRLRFPSHLSMFITIASISTVKSLNDVRSQVKSAYQSNSAITDIDVTWLTWGHSSQIGVGSVIDLLTGFVINFETMSKRCIECEHAKSGLGENSAEFFMCGMKAIYLHELSIT
ncbi:hypothetical protein TNCV_1036301 [Trichonephila clavipes]|nr:hypothetical protein TNCV_1036301 [Trichonephila clavipes]